MGESWTEWTDETWDRVLAAWEAYDAAQPHTPFPVYQSADMRQLFGPFGPPGPNDHWPETVVWEPLSKPLPQSQPQSQPPTALALHTPQPLTPTTALETPETPALDPTGSPAVSRKLFGSDQDQLPPAAPLESAYCLGERGAAVPASLFQLHAPGTGSQAAADGEPGVQQGSLFHNFAGDAGAKRDGEDSGPASPKEDSVSVWQGWSRANLAGEGCEAPVAEGLREAPATPKASVFCLDAAAAAEAESGTEVEVGPGSPTTSHFLVPPASLASIFLPFSPSKAHK